MPAAAAGSAWVLRVDDPFVLHPDARDARAVGLSETLADLAPRDPGAWLCLVDGEAIPRALWHCLPRPGSVVVFRALPQGGGRGSNPLRLLLQIAALVVIGPQGLGLTGFPALAATVAANVLINNLVPVRGPEVGGGGGGQQFNAQAQGNLARLGQPIPELFGFDNGWPDLGAQPYSLFADNDQYLHLLLVVGVGRYRIERVSVGDTSIESFSEAQVARCGPGQDTTAGPGSGFATLAEQTLMDPRWTTSADVAQVEMKTLDYVGPFAACGPERTVDRIGIDIMLPRGLDSGLSVAWRVETQPIDDFDQPTGPWAILATHTYGTRNVLPVRLSYEYTVAAGRWRVRVVRTDERSSDDRSNHDINWLALRGHLLDADIAVTDCTFVAIRIRATGQLSGSLRFRVMSRRLLSVWNGSVWVDYQDTRNPAWAFAHVLRSRGVADTQIDRAQLLALAAVWDARQDRFDGRFDTQTTMWEALTTICRVGRAVPIIRGSRYTIVRDGPETAPIAAYTMRNIRRGSMRLRPALATSDSLRALDLEYWDHRRWSWITVTAQIHAGQVVAYRGDANRPVGVPAPDANRRGRTRMQGIYGEKHALRTAAYTLADRYYRSIEIEYETELDGLLPPPLAMVTFQHDVGTFGQGGDAVSWNAGTLTLGTSEPVRFEDAVGHAVRLMRPDGTLTAMIAATAGADAYTLLLAEDPGFALLTDAADRERTRYVFGPLTAVGALARVRAIKPVETRRIAHRIVLEDDRVHTVDAQWLPQGEEQDPLPGPDQGGGGGGDPIVNINDRFEYRQLPSSGVTADWAVNIENDGRLRLGFASSIPSIDVPFQWLNPQPVAQAVSERFEVMFSVVASPSVTMAGAALDTWLGCGTTRRVEATSSPPEDIVDVAITVRIREAATGLQQDQATIYYQIRGTST